MTRTLCVLAALSILLPAHADEIYRTKGKPLTDVEIVKVAYTGVKWQKGRAKGEYKWSQIEKIVFENTPYEYQKAKDAYDRGAWAEAIAQFTKSLRRDKGVWVKQYCLWYIAQSQLNAGDVAAAGETLRKLMSEVEDTRYKPDALILLGRISLNEGKIDAAEKLFGTLIKLANEADPKLERHYYRGMVWQARCMLANNKVTDAKRQFDRVRSATSRDMQDIWLQATVGQGKCLIAEKNYAEAKLRFEAAIDKGKTPGVLAAAYNGLGETYYYSPNPEMEKALRAFLKVVVLFDSSRSELPKALWHAAKCFHKLKGSNKEWAARSAQLRNQLRDQFPNTPSAKK